MKEELINKIKSITSVENSFEINLQKIQQSLRALHEGTILSDSS